MAEFTKLKIGSTAYDMRDAQAVSADAIKDAGRYKGAYASATTYATGDIAASGNAYYKSLQDNNAGHAVTETAWWATYTTTPGFLNAIDAFSHISGGGGGEPATYVQTAAVDTANHRLAITTKSGGTTTTANVAATDIGGVAPQTTLEGYGIADAKIVSGVITLGSNTITPITAHQDISGKRGVTDLAVYTEAWNFSEFKAIQPTYIYSIKNEEGVGDYVEASGSLGTGPKNVASLMVEQPTAGAWYYHIETITEDGQALNFGPLAGHDIKKTAYEPGTDTLAKVSQIPNVPVSSVNTKTGAVVLTGSDISISGEVAETLEEGMTALAMGKQDSITANGMLKGDGAGTISAAVAGTDYVIPSALSAHTSDTTIHVTSADKTAWSGKQSSITANGILKGSGAGNVTAAVADTDYVQPSTFSAHTTDTTVHVTASEKTAWNNKLSDNTADYDPTSATGYAVGDFCKYQGALYCCHTAVEAGGEPWSAAKWTPMPNVASLFTSANTSLMGVVRYGTASAATDRRVATIVVTSETGAVPLPTPTEGAVTDVVVLLDCRGVAEIPAGLTFTGNILWSGGSAVAPVAGKMMVYGFTCDGASQASGSLCYVGNGITCG